MNGHHWLIRRNRVYYIRVRIPNYLIYLVKTSEFRYSLKTYNYYEALAKLPKESYKINLKINFLKGVDMRIRKGEIILSDEDIDRLVIHKLKQIEEVFENHYEEVANRQYDISSLTFFNSSAGEMPTPNAELDSIEIFIKEYFRDLKSDSISELNSIDSVIKDIDFFFVEKWKIASDISGSGNTANIGSITNISDLKQGNGIFSKYGEEMFDDYWMNYGKITIQDKDGKTKKITKLSDFLEYRRIK